MNVNKKCPHYKKCGGCQIHNLDYPDQLEFKMRKVVRLLGRLHRVENIIGMENPYHYRNKVQAAFGRDKQNRIISGVYQSSTHRIVPVDSCLIEDEKADEIIVTIRKLLKSFKLKTFDDNRLTGFLRHVLVKRGFSSGEIMVVLVTGSEEFKSRRSFVNALLSKHPEITTIVQNINNKRTSLVLGDKSIVLYGDGTIKEQLCGFTFTISPKSFYQINPIQTEILYNKAMEFAEIKKTDIVIDAYCGTGTIGIIASRHAGQVIGVELNRDAVRDAKKNARINDVKNIDFVCEDAGRYMVGLAEEGLSADVVIMDPPRAGSDLNFLRSLIKLSPRKVVYVSCNPETLRRDLIFLSKNKYKVRKIQPVDMFPHTEHVETVVLLTK
ncbi:MAG: 23S rRNA (uracil(1939)-C(5))-methyltransferase RlmD [Ruminococcus sp.]|nr:23S rRNA (uracil(1939)-C(5))-methyltransferase RlmD [Ruminococcus sp.]